MSLRCLLCFKKSMIRPSVSGNAHFGKRVSRMKLWSSQLRLLTSQSWEPVPDLDYLSDPKNYEAIESNINSRKGTGSIKVFMELLSKYNSSQQPDKTELKKKILTEALKIPNKSDPRLHLYGDTPNVVETLGVKPDWTFPALEFHTITKELDLLRTDNLGNLTGPRSYYLIKELAELEQALIYFTVDALEKKGFTLYSVPDLLHSRLIESCGMDTKSERTQVKDYIAH
jgi:seryl-tRNA synthetase